MDFNFSFDSLQTLSSESTVTKVTNDAIFECVIIGGGPAAMTAAVYMMRKGVSAALVTENFGGQVIETSGIENYMGYRYIEGAQLAMKFREQVRQFSIAITENTAVIRIESGNPHSIFLSSGMKIYGKTVIIASGKSWRKLGVPGEKEFTGKGVAYCTICDAPLFKDRDVIVVGGGNSGVESAIDLARVASHVTLIQNLDALTADEILKKTISTFKNVTFLFKYTVDSIHGDSAVRSVRVRSIDDNSEKDISVSGIFVEIGLVPNSSFADSVARNVSGEITINARCETNVHGIFAAGDVTDVPFKQIIIAAGEGAKAALSAYEYIVRGN
jgi:alkyl hydroperoxide reductase subunit F